jgi:asparagine synthase (glutamine-hydrolysing)
MAGIAGIYDPRDPRHASAEHLETMLDAIGHRGLAARKQWIDRDRGVAIGHVSGVAPSSIPSERLTPAFLDEGDIVAAFDGDATGLVEAWRTRPDPFASEIEDAFALCLWDRRQRQLCLARDPLGTKPLYYYRDDATGLVVFASELKGVLAHPAVHTRVDPEGLSLFLTFGYIPAPHSIVAGVGMVFPGTAAIFDSVGRHGVRRF